MNFQNKYESVICKLTIYGNINKFNKEQFEQNKYDFLIGIEELYTVGSFQHRKESDHNNTASFVIINNHIVITSQSRQILHRTNKRNRQIPAKWGNDYIGNQHHLYYINIDDIKLILHTKSIDYNDDYVNNVDNFKYSHNMLSGIAVHCTDFLLNLIYKLKEIKSNIPIVEECKKSIPYTKKFTVKISSPINNTINFEGDSNLNTKLLLLSTCYKDESKTKRVYQLKKNINMSFFNSFQNINVSETIQSENYPIQSPDHCEDCNPLKKPVRHNRIVDPNKSPRIPRKRKNYSLISITHI